MTFRWGLGPCFPTLAPKNGALRWGTHFRADRRQITGPRLSLELLLFAGDGTIDGEQAFGQGHLYALVLQVDAAEVGFGEGDEQFFTAACRMQHKQRSAGGFTIDGDDFADVACITLADVDDVTTDEVVYIERAILEWGALVAGNGDIVSAQELCIGNAVDARKL
jgi:hypothetical protein